MQLVMMSISLVRHCLRAEVSTSSRSKIDLPKNFDPEERESQLYSWWESSGWFQPNPNATGDPFVMPMPPPNVTGKLHMGHAMFVTLQDIMTRYARMAGRKTLWLPGTDHAGIATQVCKTQLGNLFSVLCCWMPLQLLLLKGDLICNLGEY